MIKRRNISEKEEKYIFADRKLVRAELPKRRQNSYKGSFGKLLLLVGSEKYKGALYLSAEAALRGGTGYVRYFGNEENCSELLSKFPEIIAVRGRGGICEENREEIISLAKSQSATLIGCGCGVSDALSKLTLSLLNENIGNLIIDADAINSLSLIGKEGTEALKKTKNTVILTPHPLEFSRLSGISVAETSENRAEIAKAFAKENNVILVLKGHRTVVTDGKDVYINTSRNSALAKAGSGDVLAGFLSSLVAEGLTSPLKAAVIAVFCHGLAGERLSKKYSERGVTPSDLPKELAKILSKM